MKDETGRLHSPAASFSFFTTSFSFRPVSTYFDMERGIWGEGRRRTSYEGFMTFA